MRFWDSTALIPLVCNEEQTKFCINLLRVDSTVIVWSLASIEVYSALCRKYHDGTLSKEEFRRAKERNTILWKGYMEITQYVLVKKRAYRLLETHQLRSSDSLHLAAALVAFEEDTRSTEFVTFDKRLAEAAEKEAFIVIGPEQLK